MTRLQEAAYNAQLAAALPVSDLAETVLVIHDGMINRQHCAIYVLAIQRTDWFRAAFPAHTAPVTVVGGQRVARQLCADREKDAGKAGSGTAEI